MRPIHPGPRVPGQRWCTTILCFSPFAQADGSNLRSAFVQLRSESDEGVARNQPLASVDWRSNVRPKTTSSTSLEKACSNPGDQSHSSAGRARAKGRKHSETPQDQIHSVREPIVSLLRFERSRSSSSKLDSPRTVSGKRPASRVCSLI